jgi:hypothetical protein
VCQFIAANAHMPSLSTINRHRRETRHVLEPGLSLSNFLYAAAFYRAELLAVGIDLGTVVWGLSCDETVVKPALQMDGGCINLVGTCGVRGAGHKCSFDFIPILDGADGYRALKAAFERMTPARAQRVVAVLAWTTTRGTSRC